MMTNITIGGVYHAKVYGADTPGPIWKAAMTGALAGEPSANLPTVPITDATKSTNSTAGNNGTAAGGTSPTPGSTLSFGNIIGGTKGGGHGRHGG
jgi:hypothetical protein